MARALVDAGHRSIVISAGGQLSRQLQAEGSRHIYLDIGHKSPWTLRHLVTLRRLLRDIKPDIVHARSRLPAWLTWCAMRGLSKQTHFVTTVHGINSPGVYSSILLRGEGVIAVSASVRNALLKHYGKLDYTRLKVIPRGVDPVRFPYGHRPDPAWCQAFFSTYPALGSAPLLTLPARGTRRKGHYDAIKLLEALCYRGIDTRLLLLGVLEPRREDYVRELRALAHHCNVTEKVVMTPARADVRNIYASSSLVLQLSTKPEAFGRTVLEALALGRPVLGYAHGGVGELLSKLFPVGQVAPGDHNALVERAAELLSTTFAVKPLQAYRLADMQTAVLALYTELTA